MGRASARQAGCSESCFCGSDPARRLLPRCSETRRPEGRPTGCRERLWVGLRAERSGMDAARARRPGRSDPARRLLPRCSETRRPEGRPTGFVARGLWVGLQPDRQDAASPASVGRIQPDASCPDAAKPVGLKADPQDGALWVGLQPDAFGARRLLPRCSETRRPEGRPTGTLAARSRRSSHEAFLWVGLQPDRQDAASPASVGRIQPDASCPDAAKPVGLKADPQGHWRRGAGALRTRRSCGSGFSPTGFALDASASLSA